VVTAAPSQRCDIAIIGAGPAGLMAAEVVASAGHAVTVYERMPSPARKFLMAGRGGLNLTHSEPLDVFLSRYGDAAGVIRKTVEEFPPGYAIDWANGLGQQTFVGSSGRVFPKQMKASPLLRAWLKRLEGLGVVLKTQHTWTGLTTGCSITVATADGSQHSVHPDAVVLALGGATWPRLGSDGRWVSILENAGIDVAPLTPANGGVLVSWSKLFADRFAGAPLKRIAITIGATKRRGEAVVTRLGLEGGVIYALGPDIRAALDLHGSAQLTVDLKPDVTAQALTERLSRPQGAQPRTNFIRKSTGLDAVAIGLLREAGTHPETAGALALLIKSVPLTVTGCASMERAISTSGGVRFSGLNADFMLSARPGVFVAGEMLDWEAPTGGYLLQAAFATGVKAAQGALRWLADPKRG
jgi:uncharacterized flavoprotein (TIGR03862 family)